MSWTIVRDDRGRPGHENMSIDSALLARARQGESFLRLYRWSPPCLSFGRHEPARRRYDAEAIRRLGLDTVRRPTGGRAVWHEHEVTYAVAAPSERFGSLREAYETIHEHLAAALASLGVSAVLAPRPTRTPGPGAGACFNMPVGGEVIVDGRKVVGSAQVRDGSALLQHGSILLEDGQDLIGRVSLAPAASPASVGLGTLLGRPVGFDEVADAIIAVWRTVWPGPYQAESGSNLLQESDKFDDPEWTWRR